MQLITSITPTICKLMGVEPPGISTAEVIDEVVDAAGKTLGVQKVEKCLIYAPDAIGETLFRDYSGEFRGVIKLAPIQVLLRSVYPTVTPVCFGSMFTGAPPEGHGITQYEKPVLRCDTLFDAFLRSGKRVAIVAVDGSSIAKIFLERELDYYIEEYDRQVNERAEELIRRGDHDLILVYNQEYDDTMHGTTPRSPEALAAVRKHLQSFVRLGKEFLNQNRGHTRLTLFSPDHGNHVDPDTGRGSHGLDTAEDMEVRSFWGVYDRER